MADHLNCAIVNKGLIAKHFINANRLKSTHILDMRAFFSMLKYKLRIEKNISIKNQNSYFDKFSRVFEAIER